MPLSDLPYTLFIWPVRVIIEFIFVLFSRIFYNPGVGVVLLSLVVNILLLPIYTVADRWQGEERTLRKKMKQKLDDIRAVFSGDERQMLINTYYRQTGYSPLLALKSSAGFLLQIPFFIAAYQFLSHTPSLSGESFRIIADLGRPDGLLALGGRRINALPLIMTAVNIASSLVYTRDAGGREKVQLFGLAFVFLILLYDSPAALTLYWTGNNVFSLGKNLAAAKLKNPGRALHILSSVFSLLLIFSVLTGIADVDRYRGLFAALGALVFAAPFIWKGLLRLFEKRPLGAGFDEAEARYLYASSSLIALLLLGLLIPSQVVSASVEDFANPASFIIRALVQGLAFCGLLPLLVWAFAAKPVRKILALVFAAAALSALIALFALSASYGVMTRSFKIEDTRLIVEAFPLWVSPAALGIAALIPGLFFIIKKQKILAGLYNAAAAVLLVMALANCFSIAAETRALAKLEGREPREAAVREVFKFSSRETNTFIMFLDRALGIALYDALEKMPELESRLDGFTFYPNTLSFGGVTMTGLPPLMGGYDYTPLKINGEKDRPLKDKINEALTMMPKLFGEAGYRVSITDPTLANMQLVPDISIFKGMANVEAQNIDGRMDHRFREEFPVEAERFIDTFDFDILFRYGVFRIAPPLLRYGLHYKGTWWRDGASNAYGHGVTEFSSLYYLGDMCAVDEGPPALNILMNETTHEPGAYTAALRPVPGLIRYSDEEITAFGSEDNASYMYTFMAAMKAAVRWLEKLKALGVYDNTRIIIVSDHGAGYDTDLFGGTGMEPFNPLLLVKEPGERGPLQTSPVFMTNADVPALAAADMEAPRNPYRGTPLAPPAAKAPLTVVDEISAMPRRHGPWLYSLTGTRLLREGNIFLPGAWEPWERK